MNGCPIVIPILLCDLCNYVISHWTSQRDVFPLVTFMSSWISENKNTIIGEKLILMTYARHSWPSSSEGSLVCQTYCDTGHAFIMVISEDPWDLHLLPVFTCIYDLCLSRLGFEHGLFQNIYFHSYAFPCTSSFLKSLIVETHLIAYVLHICWSPVDIRVGIELH